MPFYEYKFFCHILLVILIFFLSTYDSQAKGPDWKVPLGRRDSLTANQSLANANLPGPSSNLTTLKSFFSRQGLNTTDLVALSGIILHKIVFYIRTSSNSYHWTDIW